MKYVDVRIVEQVVRCLQRVVQYLRYLSAVVTVSVIDSAGEQIGELRTTKHVIETLGGRELDIARKRFELDTFGDEIMQVRTEGVPIEMYHVGTLVGGYIGTRR